MKAFPPRGILLPCVMASFLLCAAVSPAPSQTILVSSQELKDGSPLSPPLAIRDGLSASLYEEGYIVFDDNGSSGGSDASQLLSTARETGAELILQVSTEYTESNAGAAVATISARASFTLTRVKNGMVMGQGSLDANNKDREGSVDRSGLGMEIGRSITSWMRKTLGNAPS